MKNKYYIEITPLDKEKDILEIFADYEPMSFSKNDTGYDWLEYDDSKCIVFENPYGGSPLEISIGDDGRFTLFFSEHHAHYEAYQGDYEDMITMISNILNNCVCTATIKDDKEKWYGGCYLPTEDSDKPPMKMFDFVFREDEFRNHLIKYGYSISLKYWDPKYDKMIKVDSQEND